MVKTKAPAIIKSATEIEMKAHEYIVDMELNGIVYDIEENRRIDARMKTEIAELDDKIFTAIGKKVDMNSASAIGALLYGELGFEAPFKTKNGDDAIDGDALLTLAGLDPTSGIYVATDSRLQYLCDMAKRRDISSVHNTFIRTYVEDWVKRDGRVHPSYNLVGTSGFRISGDSPNLLQLPRPRHGYNVRDCYTVPPGFVFVAADFSSAEVKVVANLCKDKNMIRAILDGLDFHSFSGSNLLGIPYEDFLAAVKNKSHPDHKKCKHYRQVCKILTFSIIYGSSEGGIAMQLNVDKAEAARLMNLYFDTYPGLKKFIDESHKIAMWNQMVVTPFGQRKKEYGTHKVFKPTAAYNAALRNSANVRVQSTTSTLGLITFTHLNEDVKQRDSKSICTVYDSTEIEAPIGRAAEVVDRVFYFMDQFPMEHFDFLETPIGCEVEVGTRWGNLETIHPGTSQAEIEQLIAGMV
jgi:DNA polymerase I